MTADQRWEKVAIELSRKIVAYEPGADPPPSSRIMSALHNEYAEGRKAALRDASKHVRQSVYGDEELARQIEDIDKP